MTRLRRVQRYLARPVAWGAVLLSYAGIILAISFTSVTAINAADDRSKQAEKGRATIVVTGRAAVRNSCEFDNIRAAELKRNLVLFLEDHRQLHHATGLADSDGNIHAIQESIDSLTLRNCVREASIITGDPERD